MSRPSSTLIQDHQIQQLEGLYDTVTYATPTNGKVLPNLQPKTLLATGKYLTMSSAFS